MVKALVSVAALVVASGASAAVVGVDLGTGAPPAFLGGYSMSPFGDDGREVIGDVNGVGVAEGAPFGDLGFSHTLSHRQIGLGWSTWSNGYEGDVYYNSTNDLPIPRGDGSGFFDVTLAMPVGTAAFYLYAESDPFGLHTITAFSGNTVLTLEVEGQGGANGYGFFTDDGSTIDFITVSADVGFAIGEFGAARVPAPGALALVGMGGLVGLRRRR
ncbi:MAG TPA: hypothetical protein VG797_08665 [Phycisphaerales bacterium]|nr:hypothetical protein [Phycisphaerales bacterium]